MMVERVWREAEAVVPHLKVSRQHLPQGTDENDEKPQSPEEIRNGNFQNIKQE
jgi:hypothetical protein